MSLFAWTRFFVSILFTLTAGLVHATSFFVQPFPETVDQAPVIVRGKTGTNHSDWGQDSDGTKRLYTYYDLQVTEVLKGSVNGSSIVIRELGGEKDGVGLHVSGASAYDNGEDVVVFLKNRNSDSSFEVQGMMMGKYNLQKNSGGNEVLSGPGISDKPNLGLNEPKPGYWRLEDLRKLIHRQESGQESEKKASPSSTSTPSPTPSESSLAPKATATRNSSEPSIKMVSTAQPPASQLQSPSTDESSSSRNSPFWIGLGIGLGVLGIGGLLRAAHRKK